MRDQAKTLFLTAAAAPLLFLVACAGDEPEQGEEDCTDGHCDVLNAAKIPVCKTDADFKTTDGALKCTPCDRVLADRSGRGFFPSFTANDALVKKIFMTFEDTNKNGKIDTAEVTCPTDMPGMMAKLEKVDTKSCNGIQTRIVSEEAAKLGADKAGYRAVTSRDCDGRGSFGLLFSSFGFTGDPGAKGSGVHISEDGHPGEVEVIAFDDVDGVFNFYKTIDNKVQFFGSSDDFVVAGPGGPGLTNKRGCANCHRGGGLNMKELQSPWVHWAQEDNIVGADTLVNSRKAYMGTLSSGADMQFGVTQAGNDKWNAAKAKFLVGLTTAKMKAGVAKLKDDANSASAKADMDRRQIKRNLTATQLMLEPLFCSIQVNINSAGGNSSVPGPIFAAGRFGISASGPSFTQADATAALSAIGSTVPGVGTPETSLPFTTIEPSHEDESYVNQLVALKVLDQQLVQDVQMVDFTRGALSDDRCGLLDFVPDLDPADRKVAKIRDALIDALDKETPAAGSPGAQLLAHLKANKAGSPIQHSTTVQKYSTACQARPGKDVLRDGLKLRSLQRQMVYSQDGKLDTTSAPGFHPFSVFEFDSTMPTDNVRASQTAAPDSVTSVAVGARFNPNDCTLTDKFTPPTN